MSNIVLAAGGDDGYQISRSVRLRSSASAYFSKAYTGGSSAADTSIFVKTYSIWTKRGALGSTPVLLSNRFDGSNFWAIYFDSNNCLNAQNYGSGALTCQLTTTQVFRDPSAWYHIVVAVDTTQATAANRIKMYVNGVQITAFTASTYPSQNTSNLAFLCPLSGTWTAGFGAYSIPSNVYDGYLAEINVIDGQALTPSSFGETDTTTGVWKPKKYTGTYGNNGFYLPFSNPTLSADITASATASAPSGGVANNAKTVDGNYLTTNTSGGSAFDVVKYDFGAPVQMSGYFLGGFYFTGGTSTFQVWVSNDDVTYTNVASIGVTATGTNYSGSFNVNARYVKLRATSYGTNGQASLDVFRIVQDGISGDASGQGNHWVPNNISLTAGVTYDSMIDVPTPYADGGNGRGNYSVMNPLDKHSNVTVTSGNLDCTFSAYTGFIRSSFALPNTGKWYWEGTVPTSDVRAEFGIATLSQSLAVDPQGASGCWFWYSNGTSSLKFNGSGTSWGTAWASGDIIGIAFDADAGTLTFYKNGSLQGGGAAFTGLTGTYAPMVGFGNNTSTAISTNFGQRPFAYTPPTGFKALNTKNLPEPTIPNGRKFFDVSLWTGNGTNPRPVVSGLAFQPDLVWAKLRSNVRNNVLFDSVRGAGANSGLFSNLTDAEGGSAGNQTSAFGYISSFNADGFTATAGSTNNNYFNALNDTYVGWQWKEGATPGFDIVAQTASASGNQTINHSLGVTPSFVIIKSRSGGVANWPVWVNGIGTDHLNLNTTGGRSASGYMVSQSSTTFVFNINLVNPSNPYIAYLFAEVAGFSKFGKYTGNGSADGPFVFCGFRPCFILIKRTDTTSDWVIYDTARDTYNAAVKNLNPNLSANEGIGFDIDIISNGFKQRTSGGYNASGGTYIFAAFAENPFKYSLAR